MRTRLSDDASIPPSQVKSMINALRFEEFYAKWDANRQGPSPEALGKQDAIDEIRKRKEPDAKQEVRESGASGDRRTGQG